MLEHGIGVTKFVLLGQGHPEWLQKKLSPVPFRMGGVVLCHLYEILWPTCSLESPLLTVPDRKGKCN